MKAAWGEIMDEIIILNQNNAAIILVVDVISDDEVPRDPRVRVVPLLLFHGRPILYHPPLGRGLTVTAWEELSRASVWLGRE